MSGTPLLIINMADFVSGTHELLQYMDFVGSILRGDVPELKFDDPKHSDPCEITLALCGAYLALDQHLGFLRETIGRCQVADSGDIMVTTAHVREMKMIAEATDRAFKTLKKYNIDVMASH